MNDFTKSLVWLSMALFLTLGNAQEATVAKKRNVALFVYDGMEVLDFGGPAEVFAVASIKTNSGKWVAPFNVYTVALTTEPITSQGFVKIQPNYSIRNCPKPDILVVPGGATSTSRKTPEVIEWIKNSSKTTEVIMSVCTGAFLLGDAGLLIDQKATTWYGSIPRFRETYKNTEVLENVRFVDNGKIVTTAGVSAGIDGALHIVQRLISKKAAKETATYMEYDKWQADMGYVTREQKNLPKKR